MKNLLLVFFLAVQGCGSVRQAGQPAVLAQTQPAELTASAIDTLPVNAAQTSGQQFAGLPAAAKTPIFRPAAVRQLQAAHPQVAAPRDSTGTRTNRKPADTRIINRLGLVSAGLTLASMTSFVISADLEGRASTAFGVVTALLGIASLIAGLMSKAQFRKNPGMYKGRGYATTGLVWGALFNIFRSPCLDYGHHFFPSPRRIIYSLRKKPMLRRKPASLVRFTADSLNSTLKTSSVISSQSGFFMSFNCAEG